jgi:hypothetical protein
MVLLFFENLGISTESRKMAITQDWKSSSIDAAVPDSLSPSIDTQISIALGIASVPF